MSEKKFPDTELVEPEGFWPDDVVVHEPPAELLDSPRAQQSRVTGPLSWPDDAGFEPIRLGAGESDATDEDQSDDRPTESIRFDPATIENIGRPERPQPEEDQPLDPFQFLADAADHGETSENPLTLSAPETVQITPDRPEYISSLEMQFDDKQAGTAELNHPAAQQPQIREGNPATRSSTDEAQPRQEPVPFESYISGYTQPTQPLAAETPAEPMQPADAEQTAWTSQALPTEETFHVHSDEVPTRTWLNDPPPAAPDPFSADPYAPKLDEAWLGQTAPFDEHFVPGEFQAESRDETVRRSGLAWSAGIVFFSSVAFMLFLGWLVDLLLGTAPFGMVGGIIFGSVVGFIQFFRISSRIFSSKSSDPEIRSLMSHEVEETVHVQDPHTPRDPPDTYPPA